MPTPFDGKICLVQVKGSFLPRRSVGDVARLIADAMPNVGGVVLQTSQGKEWQRRFDNDPKAIAGPDSIGQWVSALEARRLETHVWGIPHGLDVRQEADRFVQAARVPGVRSLGLDVEHGSLYYRGTAQAARQMMQMIRDALGWNFHIALILDARRNRPFNIYVDPWLPFVDSLHPMIYPKDFARPVVDSVRAAFDFLAPYNKPIVPMLQSYNAIPPEDIRLQGDEAFSRGAAGISFFCLGDRHMGPPEFAAVAAISQPGKPQRPAPEMLPAGAVGRWPDDARGYVEHVYENAPDRPWHDFADTYGRGARWKLTSPGNDVAVSYIPDLPGPARYSIEAFIPFQNAHSRRADYHLKTYDGGQPHEVQVKLDQSAHSDEWVSLGVFDLDPRRPGDGQVNVTDYSDERPPRPIAFAGIRWVPVAPPAGDEAMSEARRLARLGPEGAGTTTAARAAEPAPVNPITNQDVINAFIVAASQFNDRFTDLINAAGLAAMYSNRNAPYAGPAIASLPNLSVGRKAAIGEALRMPAASLARAAAAATAPTMPLRSRADGRTWGVHGSAGYGVPPRHLWDQWLAELQAMGLRWYKQCDNGAADYGDGSCFRWALALRDAGLTPVIRYQRPHMFPGRLEPSFWDKMSAYLREGIVWAEIGNEPNLPWEWNVGESFVNWNNRDCIRAIAEAWLGDAEEALRRGARPAFYAMAPTDWQGRRHPRLSGPMFHERLWDYIATHDRDRARNILGSGGWLAVHTAVYEVPLDFDPFQHGVGEGAPWDMCLRGYEIPMRHIQNRLGLTGGADYAILSTEGGVYTPESRAMEGHQRLTSDSAHADQTVAMFNWLEERSPLQAMMPWCLAVHEDIGHKPAEYLGDGWYVERDGQLRPRAVVGRLKQVKAQRAPA